jgi:hypothetical protein
MLKIDGHDNAILGPAMIWRDQATHEVLVYDAEIIRSNLMKDGMTSDEAQEYIEFNIEGAYVGEQTPVIVWTKDEWSYEEEE